MKKFLFILILFVLFPCLTFAAGSESATVNSDETAGTWTRGYAPYFHNDNGFLNISVYGATWVGTVTLQRSFDDGTTWYDVTTWTANAQKALIDKQINSMYRLGCKNGEYTSGSVAVKLSN